MGGIGKAIGEVAGGVGDIVRPVFGKPDPEAQEDAAKAAADNQNLLTDMSVDFYGKTAPLREGVISRLSNFLAGNLDPTQSAMYGPIKNSVERQYGTARDAIMSQLPNGGTLQKALAGLEATKASNLTDLIGQLVQDEYNKAYSMGSGSQETTASGITSAGGIGNNLLTALANQQMAGNQGISALAKLIWGS